MSNHTTTQSFGSSSMDATSMYVTQIFHRKTLRLHHKERWRKRVLSYRNFREWIAQDGERAIGIATTTRCLCSCWMCTDSKPKHNQTKLHVGRVHRSVIESMLAEEEGYIDYIDQYLIDFCGSIDYASFYWEQDYGL